MGGSTGKILGAVIGAALAPATFGASLGLSAGVAGALTGAAVGEVAVDRPAAQQKAAAQQQQAQVLKAQEEAKAAANASRSEMTQGPGVVQGGAQAIGDVQEKDMRGAVRKKKLGASKLRIDPLASSGASAAAGTATTADTGLKV